MGDRKTIAWCPCTPPSNLETFIKKISASTIFGKEIAKKPEDQEYDDDVMIDTNGELEHLRGYVGHCTTKMPKAT